MKRNIKDMHYHRYNHLVLSSINGNYFSVFVVIIYRMLGGIYD